MVLDQPWAHCPGGFASSERIDPTWKARLAKQKHVMHRRRALMLAWMRARLTKTQAALKLGVSIYDFHWDGLTPQQCKQLEATL